jgi:hypothetical protein
MLDSLGIRSQNVLCFDVLNYMVTFNLFTYLLL